MEMNSLGLLISLLYCQLIFALISHSAMFKELPATNGTKRY